jgi:hypothetical protein
MIDAMEIGSARISRVLRHHEPKIIAQQPKKLGTILPLPFSRGEGRGEGFRFLSVHGEGLWPKSRRHSHDARIKDFYPGT